MTQHDYDDRGNKTGATTSNCLGASGRALFTSRGSTSSYASQSVTVVGVSVTIPAGTFATSAANALGHTEGRTYDPRFGVAVSLTGPNGLTTNWQLDAFGRKVKELRADGTASVSAYCLISGRVSDATSNSAAANGDPLSCPSPAGAEIPADAVSFVHSEPRDTANAKNGPFARVYSDKAGRKIVSVSPRHLDRVRSIKDARVH